MARRLQCCMEAICRPGSAACTLMSVDMYDVHLQINPELIVFSESLGEFAAFRAAEHRMASESAGVPVVALRH
jgi:hypothetical protein